VIVWRIFDFLTVAYYCVKLIIIIFLLFGKWLIYDENRKDKTMIGLRQYELSFCTFLKRKNYSTTYADFSIYLLILSITRRVLIKPNTIKKRDCVTSNINLMWLTSTSVRLLGRFIFTKVLVYKDDRLIENILYTRFLKKNVVYFGHVRFFLWITLMVKVKNIYMYIKLYCCNVIWE